MFDRTILLSTPQAAQFATRMFIGPAAGRRRCKSQLLALTFALQAARVAFFVSRLRFRRRPATNRQCAHHHIEAYCIATDLQRITDANFVGGFYTLAIEMHSTACHRLGRQRPALKEPGKPQPLVEAQRGRIASRHLCYRHLSLLHRANAVVINVLRIGKAR